MTMHDAANQLSGPSLGVHVGLRRALDIVCAGVAAGLVPGCAAPGAHRIGVSNRAASATTPASRQPPACGITA